jgi:subtilisin family serine protease
MRRHTAASCAITLLVLLFVLAAAPSSSAPRGAVDKAGAVLRQQLDTGTATFWVLFRDRADLSAAPAISDWVARGRFVVDRLRATASSSQAGVLALLRARGVEHQSFHIVNTVRVVEGDAGLAAALAARPEVSLLVPSRTLRIPRPTPGAGIGPTAPVEWNIQNINADDVWNTFNVRGRGIVVANIDTGVQFDHAALSRQYRGRRPAGVNHNYSWWDPSNICAGDVPCDNNGHGTHTMGTMVGDDGGANQIGVAPRAKWIAAKGCEDVSCSDVALMSSGEWLLAPTRLDGSNPKPNLRPHVVNNSWGGAGPDDFYRGIVEAWVASGIFPVFSNGGSGPTCGTVGSPASYPESYGVGAHDINDNIASFSGRGPSPFGGIIKPNTTAPGVNIRSGWNDGSYMILTGTSMSAPHVAGTVALMWSAAPDISREIEATRDILDLTAVDMAGACGGTESNNNTYGEGRLDAFAAVDSSNGWLPARFAQIDREGVQSFVSPSLSR